MENVRQSLLGTILLMVMALSATAAAQHDHAHTQPPGNPEGIQAQLTRTATLNRAGSAVEVAVTWATPQYFAQEMPAQEADWAHTSGVVLLVDETNHDAAALPEPWVGTELQLQAAGSSYPVARSAQLEAPEHHRRTMVRFEVSPFEAGEMLLPLGGETLTWNAADWFGLQPGERVIEFIAQAAGFDPAEIVVRSGERIAVVFKNPTALEHHFHIMGMEPEDLRWFQMGEHALSEYRLELLDRAERVTGHLCTSDSGLCRLGTNVHLHANAGQFDVVGFVAGKPGRYLIVCPLHENMRAEFVVQ